MEQKRGRGREPESIVFTSTVCQQTLWQELDLYCLNFPKTLRGRCYCITSWQVKKLMPRETRQVWHGKGVGKLVWGPSTVLRSCCPLKEVTLGKVGEKDKRRKQEMKGRFPVFKVNGYIKNKMILSHLFPRNIAEFLLRNSHNPSQNFVCSENVK